MDPDSTNVEKKQIPKESFPPCDVCGENGTGLHYGVNSCEACKVNVSIISVCPFFTNCARRESAYFLLNNGIIYRPETKFAKVMFLQVSVCPRGACMAKGHEWQRRGVCMAGGVHGKGACMGGMWGREGMCGGGHAW